VEPWDAGSHHSKSSASPPPARVWEGRAEVKGERVEKLARALRGPEAERLEVKAEQQEGGGSLQLTVKQQMVRVYAFY